MEFISQISEQYLQQQRSVFLLHGNVQDVQFESGEFSLTRDYLADRLFSKRDVVLFLNPGSGLRFRDDKSRQLFMELVQGYDALQGTSYFSKLPGDYGQIMRLLDRFIRIQGKKYSIALIIEYGQLMFPAEDLAAMDNSDISASVTLLDWSRSVDIVSNDVTICVLADYLSEVNKLLVRNPQISKIELHYPQEKQRKQLISYLQQEYQVKLPTTKTAMSKLTTGFTTNGLRQLFKSNSKSSLQLAQVKQSKKELIESYTQGLAEYIDTDKDLGLVAGHKLAKARLSDDAKLIQAGKQQVIPMGYLICGPVGTGKSFIAECFAGEIGIPAIKLKNFRDKYVGSTESNWERILVTAKALSPILVIIDEADAALGNREQSGDSGTQQRVFAKLAETMGDTDNRGDIIWMLLTARPDLLPIDLKRQGRAEVHIPLMYPRDMTEKVELFKALAAKLDMKLDGDKLEVLENVDLEQINSGADVESVLVKAKRYQALNRGLSAKEFSSIITKFRSSLDPVQVKHQVAAALAEVNDRDLIDPYYLGA